MALKWKSIKTDETKIATWEEAAKLANEDGKPTFNHWAKKVLDRAASRILRKETKK